MTLEERRKEVKAQFNNADDDTKMLALIYLNGVRQARENPTGAAARIVEQVQQGIEQGATPDEVRRLTVQLAYYLTPEKGTNENGKERF